MTYIVYADVMFGYHMLIQTTLYFMISALLRQTIRITRTILWALLTAALSTGIFLITINLSTFFYYLLYAITYFIMTYFFTKSCSFEKSMSVCVGIVVFCSVWLAGMLQLFRVGSRDYSGWKPGMLFACVASVFACRRMRKLLLEKHIIQNHVYALMLTFGSHTIKTYGFLDTGNRLYNPYTRQPVIVLDYRLFKDILSKDSYQKLITYHKTGSFPFEALDFSESRSESDDTEEFSLFPLPYSTIREHFALMPACHIQKLIFCDTGRSYSNVTAGISKEPFMDKEQYRVLLHEGLNPKREENSND